eukprot:5298954-Amphidinium_carterae.1
MTGFVQRCRPTPLTQFKFLFFTIVMALIGGTLFLYAHFDGVQTKGGPVQPLKCQAYPTLDYAINVLGAHGTESW